MLGALGFAPMWINWIMTCVTTVKFDVRLNEQLLETFSPSCGLRQGDPLSRYLFLFVAEALSLLLQNACVNGTLKEFRLNKNAPGISHLLFANDSLLFFEATVEGATRVQDILRKYCDVSGQRINAHKSSVFFSKGCPSIHITNESLSERYLGDAI